MRSLAGAILSALIHGMNCFRAGKTDCKLKYEYKHDENGQVIEKKAYRWDAYRELWKPAYLLTVTPGVYEIKLNYAEWNAKESTFNHNKQESISREGNNANLLADTQNKK